VTGELKAEIKQNKPFASLEEEVFLNLQRTANVLTSKIAEILKPFELSPIQYNVLRILRGSVKGLACSEIGERLVTKDPDITRLLDRLEKRGLIARERYERDKRVVIVRITEAGLELLQALDADINLAPRRMLGHLGKDMLEKLNALLILVRK
jgi:MarR family transcriptional regulator, organic hydroperoxide resistance regulator